MMTYHQMALSSTNVKYHYQCGNHDDSGLGSHETDGDIQARQHDKDDEDMPGQPVLPHEQMRQQQLEQPCVKTGSSRLGTDERGKCDNIGLSAACPSNEATIHSVVVAVA